MNVINSLAKSFGATISCPLEDRDGGRPKVQAQEGQGPGSILSPSVKYGGRQTRDQNKNKENAQVFKSHVSDTKFL